MNDEVLVGWAAVAAAIGRSITTTRRYYIHRGLPVGFPGGRTVIAYLSHLQAWTLGQRQWPPEAYTLANLKPFRESDD